MSNVAYAKFNRMSAAAPATPYGSGAANGAVTSSPGSKSLMSGDNPGLWLLGIGAATLGLIAASTSIKVGPFHASASV